MSDCGFTVFDTALGPFGVAWRDDTIVTVQLPEADRAATQARLVRRCRRARKRNHPRRSRLSWTASSR